MNYNKGGFPFKKTIAKRNFEKEIEGKKYPKNYTKKDINFLKQQREEVVRFSDLDAKGKKIWEELRKKKKK